MVPFGLDWFVQAGHGGNGNRNCTLVEDATLDTSGLSVCRWLWSDHDLAEHASRSGGPIEPRAIFFLALFRPQSEHGRWQAIQQYQYPLPGISQRQVGPAAVHGRGVGGRRSRAHLHVGDHGSDACRHQSPETAEERGLQRSAMPMVWRSGSTASIAVIPTPVAAPRISGIARFPAVRTAAARTGTLRPPSSMAPAVPGPHQNRGRAEVDGRYHPDASYYVPAHLERAGPFNPNGNNGFNVESPARLQHCHRAPGGLRLRDPARSRCLLRPWRVLPGAQRLPRPTTSRTAQRGTFGQG